MIKVYNPKPISEINELRARGDYNAPFSVLEAIEKINIGSLSDRELKAEIEKIKAESAMAQVSTYTMIAQAKKELEEKQAQNLVAVYQIIGGIK